MEREIKFCPHCGEEAMSRDEKKISCGSCGFEYFHNVAAACAAIIEYNGNIITTVRRHEPQKGGLDLPGGFVDPYETVEEAIRREIKEELNLELEDLRYLCSSHNRYPYNGIKYHTLDAFFVARVDSIENIHVEDDISAYKLIPKAELRPERFPFDSIQDGVRFYLETLNE